MKLIIFDMTGVLTTNEEDQFLRKITKEFELNFDEFEKRYFELLKKAEVSELTGEEVWSILMKEFNFNLDLERIPKEMISEKKFLPGVMDLINRLKESYKIAYFTNYNKFYWGLIENKLDFSAFDAGFVSYELKTRKPSKEGFRKILEYFDVKPEETLFIDDSEKNANSAKEMGINIIHLPEHEKLVEKLKEKGIEC